MKVTTNHQWRRPLYGYELPENTRAAFDHINDEDLFVKYKGKYYDLSDMVVIPDLRTGIIPELREHGWSACVDGSAWDCLVFAFRYDGGDLLIKVGHATW